LTLVERIKQFNADREPERLAIKYRLMRTDPFVLLRGTCHLFYEDWHQQLYEIDAPSGWISGDLHLENFGSFKGDNHLVYFDLNDFDEALLAPAHWELSRLMTSILVAANSLKLSHADALSLCDTFLNQYTATLTAGKAKWIERKTASGMIKDLLDPLKRRTRKELLDNRAPLHDGKRRLLLDGTKFLPTKKNVRNQILSLLESFAATQSNPEFYQPLDIARRIAGTGSLGIERYAILVKGNGSPDENYLIDLKQAKPSAVLPYLPPRLKKAQPHWKSEAERIVNIQKRAQAVSPGLLEAIDLNQQAYVIKRLQPLDDRLKLTLWDGKINRLIAVIESMGQLVAWSHLRSSGRQGSAITDAWIVFGNECENWRRPLPKLAVDAANKSAADWQVYAKAYDAGDFD